MKRWIRSPYLGLIVTGLIASAALLIEAGFDVSLEVHFLLRLVWLGVVFAALLAFALSPLFRQDTSEFEPLPKERTEVAEWFDEDRAWLQTHPDSNWTEQE
jgi:hypothetical protein